MINKNSEILEVHHRRYACKNYDKNRRVSDENFATIIESGRLSPSSYGLEPWKFLLLENGAMKEDFREFAWGVSVMVSFGYRNEEITPKKRRPLEEMFEVIK